ncbi:hypothetical protein CP10139811_0937 [Chlamydia ibidis]|uniref:Uncharacterized protein n=2 Tax=Chlamydia ibidis TaxID=1405396 RepID=S7J4K0_9CHLA|nr:hypothetical protein CP10139811_0937 [Chlamydia ibidis]EQM63092.1 hypothetical protein H359_0256 [Chlamydia ibidis 10-1398/6]
MSVLLILLEGFIYINNIFKILKRDFICLFCYIVLFIFDYNITEYLL